MENVLFKSGGSTKRYRVIEKNYKCQLGISKYIKIEKSQNEFEIGDKY